MIENRIYINSAELITEIYNDYNIQSDDFITRFPIWVANALEELNIIQAYTLQTTTLNIENYKTQLPFDFKGIIKVVKDDKQLKLQNHLRHESNKINYLNKPDTYYISNGWLYTTFETGEIELTYKALPTEFDSVLGLRTPLIYDIGVLRKYLKLYVIKQMLIRGYKHPILNLTVNNPIINPGLELVQMRLNVRNACNKFSKDRRENISEILGKTFTI